MLSPMLGEWIPMEAFAASLMDSTLDGEYFPLEASLARFLSLSILAEEIDLAVGYFLEWLSQPIHRYRPGIPVPERLDQGRISA